MDVSSFPSLVLLYCHAEPSNLRCAIHDQDKDAERTSNCFPKLPNDNDLVFKSSHLQIPNIRNCTLHDVEKKAYDLQVLPEMRRGSQYIHVFHNGLLHAALTQPLSAFEIKNPKIELRRSLTFQSS